MILDQRNNPLAFRKAIRDWIFANVPVETVRLSEIGSVADKVALQKWWLAERHKVGLAVPHWPVEYGGAGLSIDQMIIVLEEFSRANAPRSNYLTVSLNHVPATLLPFGSVDQKRAHLPSIPQGTIWCQGFSEPDAGSDLASLRCRAERDGDDYVVNGQKTWSSLSMYADWCILLVRTDTLGRKQDGVTFLLMNMQTTGIEVRPIRKSTGESRFAELFLTDVRVPLTDRVGAEGQGWAIAQATLSSERGLLRFESFERLRSEIEAFYGREIVRSAPWLDDPQSRREFVQLLAEFQAQRRQIRRLLAASEVNADGATSFLPAVVKLSSSLFEQNFAEFQTRVHGFDGQKSGTSGTGMYDYLESYGLTISAGSSEIMRNLIAERGLDMPRV